MKSTTKAERRAAKKDAIAPGAACAARATTFSTSGSRTPARASPLGPGTADRTPSRSG